MLIRNYIAILLVSGAAQGSTVLINPSFEIGDIGAGDGWDREPIIGARPWFRSSTLAHDGDWCVAIAPATDASIGQSFGAILGSEIQEFSFWLYQDPIASLALELFYVDGPSSGQIDIGTDLDGVWVIRDVGGLVDPSRELMRFRITKTGLGDARLDGFTLAVVPEPQTFSLAILGATLLGYRRRPNKAVVDNRLPAPSRSGLPNYKP